MARCLQPFQLKETKIDLPCGKCLHCTQRRASGWGFRLMQEAKQTTDNYFITLTYNDTNIKRTPNGFMTLNKTDCQSWFKRIRKSLPKDIKFKYYLAGEYGEKHYRPHYHIILLGLPLTYLLSPTDAYHAKNRPEMYLKGSYEFTIESWKFGHITIGNVEDASAMYTLKYISKKKRVGKHFRDDRQSEFSLMSKRIGANYINDKTKRWHKADKVKRLYVPIKGGHKIPMPRYYKQKLYSESELKYINEQLQIKFTKEENDKTMTQKQKEYDKLCALRIASENKQQRL